MENKDKGNENKIILEVFNCTMVKWTDCVKIKTNTLLVLLQLYLVKTNRG